MADPFEDPLAVAQANFLLTRNLLKHLYITDKLTDGELSALMEGTIKAAENSGKQGAAEILRGLRNDLKAHEI